MTRTGRPLRALSALGAVMGLWMAARVPGVADRFAAAMEAVRGPPMIVAHASDSGSRVPAIPISAAVRQTDAPALAAIRDAGAAPQGTGGVAPTVVLRGPTSDFAEQPIRGSVPQTMAATEVPRDMAAPPPPGFDLATRAYARLADGDRRGADALFRAALAAAAAGGGAPQQGAWAQVRRQLNRRWSGDGFVLFRDAGVGTGAAASPVLGGGQSGGSIAWTVDPLARRPIALLARAYAAHDDRNRIDADTAQAALGVRWQLRPGFSIAAERLIAGGQATTGDWNLRLAAGGVRRLGGVRLDGYGEAGVRGNGDLYAGGQALAAVPVVAIRGLSVSVGPGLWGSVQSSQSVVSRVDLGAGMTGRIAGGVALSADYRWRIAGNAAPANGPAVTLAVGF